MILGAGSSFLTTELMPYTATAGSTTYVLGASEENKQAGNDDETVRRVRNTLITTAVSTASAFAQEIMHDNAISAAEAQAQVEAQAYVESLSDEELEQALTQVGLLEESMAVDTEKTI